MRKAVLALGVLVVGAVVAFVGTVSVLPDGRTSAAGGTSSGAGPSTRSSSASSSASVSAAAPAGPNFPMRKLKPGEQPPQFVIFSFDGAGSHEKWQDFLYTAQQTGAQFTGFLTGIYLLDQAHRTAYVGPGQAPGKASVSFGGTPQDVETLVGDLNRAKAAGMEIGTHYNGHFCDGNDPSGDDWTTGQWTSELDQFFHFLTDYRSIDGLPDSSPRLTVTPDDIKGGRTPCLEGKPDVFFPALLGHKMTYDTSQNQSGLGWPRRIDGVWEFFMPYVPVPALHRRVIAMDYNFWYAFNGGADEPGRAGQFGQWVLQTYQEMYAAAFHGSRAPLVIGNHFNSWSGDAFNPAVRQFMTEVCGKPQTVCTTYQNVLRWMRLQDPAVLAALQARPRDLV